MTMTGCIVVLTVTGKSMRRASAITLLASESPLSVLLGVVIARAREITVMLSGTPLEYLHTHRHVATLF